MLGEYASQELGAFFL